MKIKIKWVCRFCYIDFHNKADALRHEKECLLAPGNNIKRIGE